MVGGLSNRFLNRYLKPKCNLFIGVFPVDKCPNPNRLRRPFSLIVNLSEAALPGSHFVAMYVDERNNLWYFDSFAFSPPVYNTHLIIFLAEWIRQSKIIHVTKRPVQSYDSLFCGWFVASFCLFVEKYPPSNFDSFFDYRNLSSNENNVQHLVKVLCDKIYELK